MRVLSGKRYNAAKPLLFGKSGYNLAKDILCVKTIIKSFESTLSKGLALKQWFMNKKCDKIKSLYILK